jgi:hypothetical protein
MINCPRCNKSESVRLFCYIHTAFKQDHNGCFVLVDNRTEPENIKEDSIVVECMNCDNTLIKTNTTLLIFSV